MEVVRVSEQRQVWVTPTLQFRGTVGDVLNEGGGKTSIVPHDPGETRCPPAENKCDRDG